MWITALPPGSVAAVATAELTSATASAALAPKIILIP